MPDGEAHKTLDTVRAIRCFIEAGLDRRGAVLALGGGVVGDMAGFAAATYLRGVPFVQCPLACWPWLTPVSGARWPWITRGART